MIKRDRIEHIEIVQIVLVRSVITVPSDDIKTRVFLKWRNSHEKSQ
jgi:hypothetical protein